MKQVLLSVIHKLNSLWSCGFSAFKKLISKVHLAKIFPMYNEHQEPLRQAACNTITNSSQGLSG